MEVAVYKEGDELATKFGVSKKAGEDIKPSEPLIVFRVEVTIYVQYKYILNSSPMLHC